MAEEIVKRKKLSKLIRSVSEKKALIPLNLKILYWHVEPEDFIYTKNKFIYPNFQTMIAALLMWAGLWMTILTLKTA